jgi:hypothetical protein
MSPDEIKKLTERYGKSEAGNFFVMDTIGVPHPFTVGPAHITHAQKFGGVLSKECIEDLERTTKQSSCLHRGCRLKLEEHNQALLIECRADMKSDGKINPELHAYLLAAKPLAEEDKYAGFAFVDRR